MKSYRLYHFCFAMFGAFVFPALTAAQVPPPSQYEHVKGLQPFIGFWAGEAPEGQEGGLVIVARWTANKSYGQFNILSRNGEERRHIGMINIGWDGAEKKLAMWAFFPDMQAKAYPVIDGGTMKWSSEGTSTEGEETSADVTFEIDGDTLTVEVHNSRRGDAPQPDMSLSLKRRQRGERDN